MSIIFGIYKGGIWRDENLKGIKFFIYYYKD